MEEATPVIPALEKTADRPHAWTIRLSVASAVVSLVGMFVSLGSYRVADRSMRVAQRAYLDSRLVIPAEVAAEVKANLSTGTAEQAFYLDVVLYNGGNTPASSIHFTAEFRAGRDAGPSTGRLAAVTLKRHENVAPTLGPKAERSVRILMSGPVATVASLLDGYFPDAALCLSATYEDIFQEGQQHAQCFSIVDTDRSAEAKHDPLSGSGSSSWQMPVPTILVRPW